ncbi:hypothetical protein U737_15025 [Methylomonas sp. LW13]|uniref:GTPase-associated system all-helical protein GASH n=1 Tax=unclassified Methylomonas TaxID=2608980 RepID=UPI00051BA498|nr:GTPase-associated system all-helical protein GASH [Methylomonas sp. LW13]QBC28103.1 hypothetical protein U737_15025 [Methylomonas sp. LW13]
MTDLLTDLWNTGLIDKVDGHDDRLTKMESAAVAVAKELRGQPLLLIGAILAGLDPDIPIDDPALVQAERALINEWKSMRSVHTDRPVNLLRAILLAACNLAANDGNNAAILWLTAVDTLQLLRLGKEEAVVRQMLATWAKNSEESLMFCSDTSAEQTKEVLLGDFELPEVDPPRVDRDSLLLKVQASAGPSNEQGEPMDNPNPHWTNSHQQWVYQFAPRMQRLLADELDILATSLCESQTETIQHTQNYLINVASAVNQAMSSQQNWVIEVQQSEQTRLNALWWSEALYSSFLNCSYRELPQTIATVVMAIDLLNEVTKPTPASVGYLLAEAVNRLPEAGFDRKLTLQDLLAALVKDRAQLPKVWLETLTPLPETGRLSLRDLVVFVLANPTTDITAAIKRTGASGEFELSLPKFAHALFRQEQAVQLAGNNQ